MAITKTTNLSLQKIDAAEKLSDFPSVQAQNMDVLDAQVAKKADKTSVPTKTSDLTNDSGFLTAPPKYTKADVGLANVANIDQSKAVKTLTLSGTTLTATALDGTTQDVTLPSSGGTATDTNTTYTLSKSGSTITLTGSDGKTSSVTDAIGANTTYTLSKSGSTITLTGSDGKTSSVTDSTGGSGGTADGNTTYTLSKSGTTITLTGSDGSTSSVTDSTGSGGTATPATTTTLGGVRVGKGLTVDYEGTLSVTGSTSDPVEVKRTWPVTYSLTNASCSPSPATVTDGQSYTLTFTVGDGYEFDGTPTVKWTDTAGTAHTVSATNGSATFTASGISGSVTVTAKGKEKAVEPTPTPGDVPTELESQSWASLSALAKGKTASELSSLVGLEKTVAIDGYGSHKFRVIGVGHDKATGDSSRNTITFECVDIVTTYNMNSDNTADGGWEKCGMRSWLDSNLLTKLPSDLQSAIVAVDKHNTDGYGAETTSDRLWIESCQEIGLGSDITGEGAIYDYWSKHNDNSSRVKMNGTSNSWWWIRSANSSSNFRNVIGDGSRSSTLASTYGGVVPCFGI